MAGQARLWLHAGGLEHMCVLSLDLNALPAFRLTVPGLGHLLRNSGGVVGADGTVSVSESLETFVNGL